MRVWGFLLFFLVFAVQAASMEDDFLAAREAYRAGQAAKLDGYAKRLRGYVLEPYVAYWQFNLRIEQASPGEVRAFLAAHRDAASCPRGCAAPRQRSAPAPRPRASACRP